MLPEIDASMSSNITMTSVPVGMSTRDPDHLKFLFEMSEDFSVLPSFSVIPTMQVSMGLSEVPGLSIDPTKV